MMDCRSVNALRSCPNSCKIVCPGPVVLGARQLMQCPPSHRIQTSALNCFKQLLFISHSRTQCGTRHRCVFLEPLTVRPFTLTIGGRSLFTHVSVGGHGSQKPPENRQTFVLRAGPALDGVTAEGSFFSCALKSLVVRANSQQRSVPLDNLGV